MNCAELADRITQTLGLSTPPVALAFVDKAPEGISGPPQAAPSACTFWREAERQTFYASAADHANCPVGAMVMGFALAEDVAKQLGELVTGMCDCHYLAADEPERIPTVPDRHAGIVYGPLAERTTQPDVGLLWASPQQAMLCNEAMGTANWAADGPLVSGRPGCAALPVALSAGRPAISFGCAGMRTFTGVADDLMLIAIPGSALEAFATALEEIGSVNSHMLAFYRGRRAQFPLTAV